MYRPIFVSALLFCTAPAFAQVYKWVDDKGVVNYSNEAPADRKSTLLDPKSARVSTYSTGEAPKRAPAQLASASESDRALHEKIDRLERKLDAERYARQNTGDAQAQTVADARYAQCLRDRRVDCDYSGMDPYYYDYGYGPYYPGIVYATPHVRHHRPFANRPVASPKPVARSSSSGRAGVPSRQM
jgi:uncharacterized protein DUF4124